MTEVLARQLDALLDNAVHTSIPSASLCIRQRGKVTYRRTVGLACMGPLRPAVPHQVYDLASLTKALVTAPVAAALSQFGLLDIHAPVREVLDDVDLRITPWHLLCHTSGLPAWNAFHQDARGVTDPRRTILDAARATAPDAEPGTRHTYSDIGYLVLLDLLETLTGHRIDQLYADLIADPARLHGLSWGHPDAAATERDDRGLVEGTVHDPNCAAMGGISSHAGLFGTAAQVAALAEWLTLGDHPVSHTLRGWWSSEAAGSHRGGWDTPTRGGYSSTGTDSPDDTVGHLGYTGTSVWVAREAEIVVALLTNRVHPDDSNLDAIRALRPTVHDAIWRACLHEDPSCHV